MQVRRFATGFAAACDSYWRTSPKFRPRHLAYYGCQIMRPCLLLLATLVLCGPVYAADAPRERLLMDFGWRFQNGDPNEVGTSLDYPEVKDLAKIRKADLQLGPKLEAERVDAVKAHLGEKLAVVRPKFDDSAWREVD